MKTATLIGYHGYQNFGDDIFFKVTCEWLQQKKDIKRCFVTATKDSVLPDINGIEIVPFIKPYRISRLRWISILIKAYQSNIIIFSAGSIFTIQPFIIMYLVLRILKLIKRHDFNIYALGVSIGPFKNNIDQYWCKKSLELMDYVQLRDSQSIELLKRLNYKGHFLESYDLALALKVPTKPQINHGQIKMALAITSRGFGYCDETNHSSVCDSIFHAVDKAMRKHPRMELNILSVCSDELDGDTQLTKHIRQRFNEDLLDRIKCTYYDSKQNDEMMKIISECNLMISSRMHAGILATMSGVPTYQISYAEKITNFFLHTGISLEYLKKPSEVESESLFSYIEKASNGMLNEFSIHQQQLLMQKGRLVQNDLSEL